MQTPGLAAVAQELARDLARVGEETPRLRPLAEGAPPRRVAAVDGSNVTLAESGSHLVGAVRVAGVVLEDGRPRAAPPLPPQVVLLTPRDSAERPSAALEALREQEEHALVLRLLDGLREGDLLLLDGALSARPPLPLIPRIVERAHAAGVDVVGVCKSTSLTIGGVPALAACALAAREQRTASAWWAEIPAPPSVHGRVCVARLSKAEDRPFRFDIASPREPDAVLASVAALSRHPAQPGYPSPLAMAHHRATIGEDERRRLAAAVRDAARDRGVREDAWRAAFLDWHDVLELGV